MYTCPLPHTEPTLTIENLTNAMDTVLDVNDVAYCFDIPFSKRWEIEVTHPNVVDRRQVLFRYYITRHPAPTWLQVADAMWEGKDTALFKVNSLYLRGKTCTYNYVCFAYVATLFTMATAIK